MSKDPSLLIDSFMNLHYPAAVLVNSLLIQETYKFLLHTGACTTKLHFVTTLLGNTCLMKALFELIRIILLTLSKRYKCLNQ